MPDGWVVGRVPAVRKRDEEKLISVLLAISSWRGRVPHQSFSCPQNPFTTQVGPVVAVFGSALVRSLQLLNRYWTKFRGRYFLKTRDPAVLVQTLSLSLSATGCNTIVFIAPESQFRFLLSYSYF